MTGQSGLSITVHQKRRRLAKMSEFSPLQEILKQERSQPIKEPKERIQSRKESNDNYVFLLIVAVFVLGVSFLNIENGGITGRVVYEEHTESVNISSLYNESTNISFALNGKILSFRITGNFIGNGTARIYLGDKVVIDKNLLTEQQTNLITGMQVYDDAPVEVNESASNFTEQNEATDGTITLFDNYCLETCTLDLSENITLVIELNNTLLNLTSISYTYVVELTEEVPPLENLTFENETVINESVSNENITVILNETDLLIDEINLTVNETLLENTTINETLNETINELLNITQDITVNETMLVENVSLNLTEINIVEIPLALTAFEKFNQTLTKTGLKILGYNTESSAYKVGIDENNFVEFSEDNVADVAVSIEKPEDNRLTSDLVVLENLTGSALVKLKSEKADTVLRCIQFTDNICKRWEKTEIPLTYSGNTTSFTVNERGIYSTLESTQLRKEYIQTSSVYYNTDCNYCEQTYNCQAEKLCILQSGGPVTSFTAQFDFDILDLSDDWESAEICAYLYYNSGGQVINYLKDSPESYCSDIKLLNSSTPLISYKLVQDKEGWVCIDATYILRENQQKGYSNVFIDLTSQNFGTGKDFNCYLGVSDIGNCGYYNPSGSSDCRPYLRMTYK
jgi:hypothetical protein